ncbi:MAG: hypothetical protein WBO35_05725 [Candidatus Saccharimonadales bacterium]
MRCFSPVALLTCQILFGWHAWSDQDHLTLAPMNIGSLVGMQAFNAMSSLRVWIELPLATVLFYYGILQTS